MPKLRLYRRLLRSISRWRGALARETRGLRWGVAQDQHRDAGSLRECAFRPPGRRSNSRFRARAAARRTDEQFSFAIADFEIKFVCEAQKLPHLRLLATTDSVDGGRR